MTCTALLRPCGGELEVPVARHDDEAVALHARDRLRDRGARVPETLGDARTQRHDVLLLEVEDRAQVHLGRIDQIGHAGPPESSQPVIQPTGRDPVARLCRMPSLVIPVDLLPADGRFGCGPSKVRPEQLAHLAAVGPSILGTSHRQAPVKDLVGRVRAGLSELFGLPDGYEVVLGNGGSTAFWDAAAFGLIERRAQNSPRSASSAPSSRPPPPRRGSRRPTCARPTPAPERCPKPRPASTCTRGRRTRPRRASWPRSPASTATPARSPSIDATSAAGGIMVDPSQFDVYYFAPQKNFASDGGIWFALMSPAAIERVERIAASGRYIPEFLSLKNAVDNSRLNQTLNTPALATLLLLEDQLDWMNGSGGLAWADARTRESSSVLYDWAERTAVATPVRHRTRRTARRWSSRSTSTSRRMPRGWPRSSARTASSTPSRIASSDATSCASPRSRRSSPMTCGHSRASIDYVLEQLG